MAKVEIVTRGGERSSVLNNFKENHFYSRDIGS